MAIHGQFVFRRALGGVCHYARVALAIVEREDETRRSCIEGVEAHGSWLAAALRGAADARALVARSNTASGTIVITFFHGTVADTSEEAAWCAGAMAVLAALQVVASVEYDGGLVVRLRDGTEIRPAPNAS